VENDRRGMHTFSSVCSTTGAGNLK
jgi:hypothetical protein